MVLQNNKYVIVLFICCFTLINCEKKNRNSRTDSKNITTNADDASENGGTQIQTSPLEPLVVQDNNNKNDSNNDDSNGNNNDSDESVLVITSEPSDVSIQADETAIFSVVENSSDPSVSFQWYFMGVSMVGETSRLLSISGVQLADVGEYYVVISTPSNSVQSASATLSVSTVVPPPPSLSNQVATGHRHSCHIKSGALFCWGDNEYGQIGIVGSGRKGPTPVSNMASGVTAVAAAGHITCAIKDQDLFCWGYNNYGQVGDGSKNPIYIPYYLSTITEPVVSVALGRHHSCAITDAGKLFCWGRNISSGGVTMLGNVSVTRGVVGNPTVVAGMNSGVTHVSLGRDYTCAIQNSALKCWGASSNGQLGRGGKAGISSAPDFVSGLLSNVSNIGLGENHACAVHNGDLKCWGLNDHGEVGDNTKQNKVSAVTVITSFGSGLISLGEHSSCVFSDTNQKLECWGANGKAQLAQGSIGGIGVTPKLVPNFTKISSFARSSYRHRCMIDEADGNTYCWGINEYKVIDLNTTGSKIFKSPCNLSDVGSCL